MSQAKEQSIKEKIKSIAQNQERTFNDVWQEAVLERWLARLAQSKYRKNFIFKGAMCLLNYIPLHRETRDLDFLFKDLQANIEIIKICLQEISSINLSDEFLFHFLEINLLAHNHMRYPGYSVSILGQLGKTKTKIFIDIGVGDLVEPQEMTMRLLSTEKSPLYEQQIQLWSYPIETIFAEKLETAISRSGQNSRMKDYHDLVNILRNKIIDNSLLKNTIKMTFFNRNTSLDMIKINKIQHKIMQSYWDSYLQSLTHEARKDISSNFKNIIDEINSNLILLGIIKKI